MWNESWAPIATGGGAMVIYARPSWQQGVDPGYGDHRLVPDTAWNAAVNGGVDVYHRLSGLQLGQYYGLLDDLLWHVGGDTADRRARRPGQRRPGVAGQQPIGLLDLLLYKAVGAADYADIVPQHYGSAPKIFAGAEAGVSDPMFKSVGTDRHHP